LTNLSFLLEILLVTDDVSDCLFADVLLDLLEPGFDIFKGLPVGEIIYYEDCISAAVVAACNGPEPLLPCCIPLYYEGNYNLEFDCFAVDS
jgi:hypothetical protein